MNLNMNDDERIENISQGQLQTIISALPHDEFLILTQEEQTFIQVYHHDDDSFQIEYRDGSFEKHFRVTDTITDRNDVKKAFARFLNQQPGWKDSWTWEKVHFDEDFEGDLGFHDAYHLNGEDYRKVPYGEEQVVTDNSPQECPGCNVDKGSFHSPKCNLEECPCCHGLLADCPCE